MSKLCDSLFPFSRYYIEENIQLSESNFECSTSRNSIFRNRQDASQNCLADSCEIDLYFSKLLAANLKKYKNKFEYFDVDGKLGYQCSAGKVVTTKEVTTTAVTTTTAAPTTTTTTPPTTTTTTKTSTTSTTTPNPQATTTNNIDTTVDNSVVRNVPTTLPIPTTAITFKSPSKFSQFIDKIGVRQLSQFFGILGKSQQVDMSSVEGACL